MDKADSDDSKFAALVCSGNLEYTSALRMVRRRAEVMARCSRDASKESGGEYGMTAVICEEGRLESLIETIHEFLGHNSKSPKNDSSDVPPIEQVLIANINSKNQIVLSGDLQRIKELLVQLRQFGGHDPRAVRLKTDSPFHSPIMMPAVESMKKMLDKSDVTFPGNMPCISNVSALPFASAEQLKDLLARQAVETVKWNPSIRYLDQERKTCRWIGIGPGKVGRNLVGKEVGMKGRDVVKGGGVWGVSDPKEIEEIVKALDETEKVQPK